MRSLAAALIPYMPEVDAELATNMASDPKPPVRRELAQAIVNTRNNLGDNVSRPTTGSIRWSTSCEVIQLSRAQILGRLS